MPPKTTNQKVHIGNALFSTIGFDEVLEMMREEIASKCGKYFTAITNIQVGFH